MNNILITGASSDVGVALIEKVHSRYDTILAHYNHSYTQLERLQELYGEKIILIQGDFGEGSSIKNMIDNIQSMSIHPNHIIHLAASKAQNKPFLRWNMDDYDLEYKIGVKSIIEILEAFLPNMVEQKNGKIIFMLSSFVTGVPPKYQSPYIVSKYALLGLMKNLAAEYTEKGILVNAISPDMIETKFNEKID